jgi:hypothetical protein
MTIRASRHHRRRMKKPNGFGPSRPYIVMTASVAGPPHGNYRKVAVIETDGTTLPCISLTVRRARGASSAVGGVAMLAQPTDANMPARCAPRPGSPSTLT